VIHGIRAKKNAGKSWISFRGDGRCLGEDIETAVTYLGTGGCNLNPPIKRVKLSETGG